MMNQKIIKECIRRALCGLNDHPSTMWRHFSFVIKDNKIISQGTNRQVSRISTKTSIQKTPVQYWGYPAYADEHAEINAFFKARHNIGRREQIDIMSSCEFDIINIRLNKIGQLRLAAPCPICFENLKAFGCRRVYYSTDSEFSHIRAN